MIHCGEGSEDACFSWENRQQIGMDSKTLRHALQNTTVSSVIAFLVRKGPLCYYRRSDLLSVALLFFSMAGSFGKLLRRFLGRCPLSRAKKPPQEEVCGTDIPRTSVGHSRGYPGPKLRSGSSKSWKNKRLGADIHDPKARTSTTPRDLQKLWSEKLRAEFLFPTWC